MEHADWEHFLSDRTVVLTGFAGTEPPRSATGFMLRSGDALAIVTACHVLDWVFGWQQQGVKAWIEASRGNGEPGVQFCDGFVLMPNDGLNHGHENTYRFLDFGFIRVPVELEPAFVKKLVFSEEDCCKTLPGAAADVRWLGAMQKNVCADPQAQTPYEVATLTPFTSDVVRSEERRIVVRGFPAGVIDPIALKGVSGSALVGRDLKLRGVIWGGHKNKPEIYACPIGEVLAVARERLGDDAG